MTVEVRRQMTREQVLRDHQEDLKALAVSFLDDNQFLLSSHATTIADGIDDLIDAMYQQGCEQRKFISPVNPVKAPSIMELRTDGPSKRGPVPGPDSFKAPDAGLGRCDGGLIPEQDG